jgi:hypothetical protein
MLMTATCASHHNCKFEFFCFGLQASDTDLQALKDQDNQYCAAGQCDPRTEGYWCRCGDQLEYRR